MSPEGPVTPSVHPELEEHQSQMQPRMYTLRDHIHMAYAYSTTNCTMIEGDDGVVLVDTLQSVEQAEPVAAAARRRSSRTKMSPTARSRSSRRKTLPIT